MRRLLSAVPLALSLCLIMLFAFATTAFAAGAVAPDDGSLLDLARPVYDAIMGGHYIAAAAFALVLAVALVRRYAPDKSKVQTFVHSDAGAAVTTLLMAFGGAMATATLGGAAWHWAMLWTSATVAFAAAGSYAIIKKLVIEPLQASAWYAKAPAWLKAALQVVFWLFDKPDAVKAAEAAGDAAVAAKPGQGLAAVAGKPTELK